MSNVERQRRSRRGSLSKEARELIGNSARLARLCAAALLEERRHLTLVERPSFEDFKETVQALGVVTPNDLPELEQRLSAFQPNPLWLSWIQSVHGNALARLAEEIHEWSQANSGDWADAPGSKMSVMETIATIPSGTFRSESMPKRPRKAAAARSTKKKK